MSDAMPELLKKLIETARLKRVPKDQIIFYEGDRPLEVFIIKAGIVKLHNIDNQGNEKILHLLKPSSVLPLAFFSGDNPPMLWYYTALTDSELYEFSFETMHQLMEADGNVATYLINHFSDDVHEVLVRLESLSKTNVPAKLTAVLGYLVACHAIGARKNWWRVPFPINHQLLADMIGVSRESTSLAMKVLADNKIVRNPKLTTLEINSRRLVTYREKLVPND